MKKDKGYELIRNPRVNKGMAFTREERKAFGLEGLMPKKIETLELQVMRVKNQLEQIDIPIYKYAFLNQLFDS